MQYQYQEPIDHIEERDDLMELAKRDSYEPCDAIPHGAWTLFHDLSCNQIIILYAISGFRRDKGCFAPNEYFAETYNLSIGGVKNILSTLRKKDYIEVVPDHEAKRLYSTQYKPGRRCLRVTQIFIDKSIGLLRDDEERTTL